MKLKIYTVGGAVINCNIAEEYKESIVNWFKGKGRNIITLNDENNKKLISRKSVSVIEFIE
jgi:hypothetical protein